MNTRHREAGAGRATRGSVTAETAVVLPALVFVLVAALWVVGAVGAEMACVDAARVAARAVARGEPLRAARAAATRAAPSAARVAIRRAHGLVRVEVSAPIGPMGDLLHGVPSITVRGHAVAAEEPGEDGP